MATETCTQFPPSPDAPSRRIGPSVPAEEKVTEKNCPGPDVSVGAWGVGGGAIEGELGDA